MDLSNNDKKLSISFLYATEIKVKLRISFQLFVKFMLRTVDFRTLGLQEFDLRNSDLHLVMGRVWENSDLCSYG